MWKKIILGIIVTGTMFMIGCAKETSREAIQLEVVIKDTIYRGGWSQPMIVGKTTTFIHHPTEYNVYLLIEGNEKKYDDSSMYEYCRDKVGQTVNAEFVKIYYDDNSVRYDFVRFLDQ